MENHNIILIGIFLVSSFLIMYLLHKLYIPKYTEEKRNWVNITAIAILSVVSLLSICLFIEENTCGKLIIDKNDVLVKYQEELVYPSYLDLSNDLFIYENLEGTKYLYYRSPKIDSINLNNLILSFTSDTVEHYILQKPDSILITNLNIFQKDRFAFKNQDTIRYAITDLPDNLQEKFNKSILIIPCLDNKIKITYSLQVSNSLEIK